MKIIKAGCLENDILFFPVPDVIPPFFNQLLHICRNFRVEREAFSCRGMFKSQGFGMEGLPGTNAETVIDELFVFGKSSAFEDFVSAVLFVVEQGVFDVFEMCPDLMGPAGFQNAFHDVYIA